MHKLTFLLFLSFVLFKAAAQHQTYRTNDTLLIDEVKISAFQPVNDRLMLNFYKTSQFSSIDDITARLGGVSLIRRGAYAMEPLIHGMGAGRINVTIDGMHMFGACTDKMDPVTSYIEPVNLSSIQVLSGSEGNRMGSTIGGSLNMVTEEPIPGAGESYGAEGGLLYTGNSKGIDGNISFYLNQNRWALLFSTTTRNHSEYRDGNGSIVPFSQFSKKNMHGAVAYQLKENQIIRGDILYDDARNVGYPALPMDVSQATGQIYSLDYKLWNQGKLDLLRVKLYGNAVYHQMDDSQRDSVFYLETGDTVVMRMDMPGWSKTFGAYAQADYRVGNNGHLFVKLDNYLNQARAEMTMHMRNFRSPGEPPMYVETWPDMQRFVSGLYTSYAHNFSEVLKLIADVRLDYSTTSVISVPGQRQFTVFGYDVSKPDARVVKGGNVTLKVNPDKQWMIYVGGGYSERIPDISELYGFYLFNAYDGYDYIGNPDLKNEAAFDASFKLSYTSDRFKLKGEAGLHFIHNYIMGITNPSIPKMNLYASGTRMYQNIDGALISGNSLYMQWLPAKFFGVVSTFRYTYGRLSTGEPVPLIEPFKNYTTVYVQKNRFTLQAENEIAAAQNRINIAYGETKTPGYNLINLRLLYETELQLSGVEIGAGVNNILNKTYKTHLDWGNIYRPGRSVYVSLRIKI
ncbi:TonB-dependent receptor plug domain-containing protein [Saccharicrinis sp. FJH54]|uniref:TonB-dependent receptor plug domain-containing protein n=1 Tax=Saccharicrinis sp. FJH54 TaxID=3344665 RepID=UPI0035D4B5DF